MIRSTSSLTEGQAAGFGDWFSGIKAGALHLSNYTTYYRMKERTGRIGVGPVNALLGHIRAKNAGCGST